MLCDTRGIDAAPPRSERPAKQRLASAPPSAHVDEALAYAPAAVPVERDTNTPTGQPMTSGIVPELAAKVAQIQSSCPGAHVISGLRHTRIRGTGRMSLHATGEAVDMRGNPSCVYAQLRDWKGGYSTDYGRVQHVHISLAANGREAGLRFAHGGGRHHHRHRHARR